ncbi:MAG: tetratricopeptide repeat protein [Acidobacteriota bacterium]
MRRRRSFCFVAALVLLAGQTEAQSTEAERIRTRAVQLHQSGDIEGAVREYRAYFELGPESAALRSNLGAAYARLGRTAEAIAQYRRALELDASNQAVRFNLGLAYYKAAKMTEAITELTAASLFPAFRKNATVLLAECYLQRGDYKKVIELLQPLENENRDDRSLSYLLGTALIRDNQTPRGKVVIDRIMSGGDSAEARLILGTAQLLARDFPGALEQFRLAVALNPQLPAAHSFYGRTLLATGNRDQALEAFRSELAINPNDFESNLFIGVLLKQEEKYEEALRRLAHALEMRPGTPDVLYQIGSLHLAAGNLVEAERVLAELVRAAPEFVEAHVSLATVYYRLKRKGDGDRHRAAVTRITAERQTRAVPAGKETGTPYRGEGGQLPQPSVKDKQVKDKPNDRN